jgi:uncharacterized protein
MEKTICNDKQLNFADEYMGHLYFAKLASIQNPKKIKTFHRYWLSGRQEECPGFEVSCLLRSYDEYIQRLQQGMPALWRKNGNNQYTWWGRAKVNEDMPELIFAVRITVSQDAQGFATLFDGARAKPANQAFYQEQRYSFDIQSINIFQNFKNIQSINNIESETYGAAYSFSPIKVGDFNFDGHTDISAHKFVGGVNTPEHYWLFQPSTQQFVYSDTLSAISSAEFFKDKKLIKSSWKSSCCHHGEDYYHVKEGKITRAYQKAFKCESTKKGCTYTVTKWLKGEPVTTQQQEGLSQSFNWLEQEITLN